MKIIFSIPKLIKSKHNGWFVSFRYDKKEFRFKYNLNKIDNEKEKLSEFKILESALYRELRNGWNPNIAEPEDDIVNSMPIIEALNFAMEKKAHKISKKTNADYSSTLRFIIAAIKKLDKSNLQINQLNRLNVKLILEQITTSKKSTPKSFNKYLDHFRAILGELIQWDIIENNPASKINYMTVGEIEANIPASPEQQILIKTELKKHPDFSKFVQMVFFTGIRPYELLQIKVGMINLEKKQIILPPEITKKPKQRIVPINEFLEANLNIGNIPNDYYLFGSFRESGKGNVGPKKDFIPGPTSLNRDTATKRWHKIIKIGLGLDVNLYSNKKLGANAMILNGVSLDALKTLFGHSSKLTTEIYATKIKEVHRNEILNKSVDY